MRQEVINHLYKLMKTNKEIIVLVGDLGFGLFDKIRDDYPDRFINTGAAEAACSDICVGLALSGKIPVMYSITPFLLYRCFETWRTYVNHEKIKVILLGSGRDNDYHIDGFSHDASDIYYFLEGFANMGKYYPDNNEEAIKALNDMMISKNPSFLCLQR